MSGDHHPSPMEEIDTYTPSSKPQPTHNPVVCASARPSSASGRWFRQLGVVCRLNSILLIRYWKAAVLQAILLPLMVIGIVFGIQKAYVSDNGLVTSADNTVLTWKMDGIHQCKVMICFRSSILCLIQGFKKKKKSEGCCTSLTFLVVLCHASFLLCSCV